MQMAVLGHWWAGRGLASNPERTAPPTKQLVVDSELRALVIKNEGKKT